MKAKSAALFLFVLLLGLRASACSCAFSGGACGALKPGGTMFLGEVIGRRAVSIPEFPGRNDLFTQNYVFRIRVVEAFSAQPKAGEEVDIRTGGGGGDCGYGFVVGRRYLVDAYGLKPASEIAALRDVQLGTSICSRTREEEVAGIQLRELRTGLAHRRQPDLHGSLRSLNGMYADSGRPLANIPVAFTAQLDGAVYRAVTDADGIFTFETLPPGDYRPAFDLPEHQKLISYDHSKPMHVVIPANNGAGLACHLDAQAGPSGGVRLRVIDAAGKPLAGSVVAHVKGTGPRAFQNSQDGNFELGYLADGNYQIEFNDYTTHMRGTGTATVSGGNVTTGVVLVASPFTP